MVIGGGIVGASVAYHLTEMGWDDIVLLERKKLTSGTTWHAAGLVGQLRATQNLTKLAQYTTELLTQLEKETGQATGFKRTGSLSIANNAERFEELKRGVSMARNFGLEAVPHLPDGLNKGVVRVLYLGPQPPHVHIHSSGSPQILVAPYLAQQYLPRVDPAGAGGQEHQQLKLFVG